MRKLVRLRRLPWGMKTEKEVREALERGQIPTEKLRGVQFLKKASKPSELAASAVLEFERDVDATEALRAIRRTGLEIDGVDVRASARIGPSFTEEGVAKDQQRLEAEKKEDPLGAFIRDIEAVSNELPTLEHLRDVYVDDQTDQWDFFRDRKMPGLTKKEWLEEDALLKSEKNGEEGDEFQDDDDEPHPSEVQGKWAETVVKVDRVAKVVRGGTLFKFRALVCVGNLMGAGGFAYGKAATPQQAIAKASLKAKENLFYVERFKNVALAHDVRGKHNNCTVDIFAVQPGYGTKGSALGRTIMNQLGFGSFTIKAYGRRTPASYVYATFDALSRLRPVEETARNRGRRLLEIETRLTQGRRWPNGFRKYD